MAFESVHYDVRARRRRPSRDGSDRDVVVVVDARSRFDVGDRSTPRLSRRARAVRSRADAIGSRRRETTTRDGDDDDDARRGRERRDDARRRAMRATRDGATRDARDGATRDGGERGEDDVR